MDQWASPERFSVLQERLGLPAELVQRLWVAVDSVPDKARVQSSMEEAFQSAPTYQEFCNLTNRLDVSSAGGMSGLTYSMIKA